MHSRGFIVVHVRRFRELVPVGRCDSVQSRSSARVQSEIEWPVYVHVRVADVAPLPVRHKSVLRCVQMAVGGRSHQMEIACAIVAVDSRDSVVF